MAKEEIIKFTYGPSIEVRGKAQLIADTHFGGNLSAYLTYLVTTDYNSKKDLFNDEMLRDCIDKLLSQKEQRKRKSKSNTNTESVEEKSQNVITNDASTNTQPPHENEVSPDEVSIDSSETHNIEDKNNISDKKDTSNTNTIQENLHEEKNIQSNQPKTSTDIDEDEDDILNAY